MSYKVEEMLLFHREGFGRNMENSVLWTCAFCALFWHVWTERYVRIFENQFFSKQLLWDRIAFSIIFMVFC